MDNHFIMGYGCGSYTMVSENGELENFSSYAPNLLVMLFVENGLFGLLLSVGVTILFGCRMWKYRTNNYVRGTVCVLCVIVLKEMSQATFLHLKYMCFLIVLLLAYVSSFSRSITERINVKHVVLSVICILFVALDLHLTYNKGRQIPNDIKKEFDMLENKDEFYYSRSPGEKKLENACAREPYDEYVKYIIAESNIKQGHIGDGIAQLSMLCEKYSCNAAFAFSCGNAYCAIGDKEKAIAYWEKGILQFPRLLLCDEYINIGVCDTVLFSRLNDKILGDYPGEKVLKGKEYAKWGFILNRLGNTDEAIKLLRHSVTYSPNLPVPWLILGDKQKYHFLVNGPFPNYKYYDNHEENVTFTLFELIRNVYSIRFATWYADKLVGNAS
jgi:tetratricopeptide (TPR) repeat protein